MLSPKGPLGHPPCGELPTSTGYNSGPIKSPHRGRRQSLPIHHRQQPPRYQDHTTSLVRMHVMRSEDLSPEVASTGAGRATQEKAISQPRNPHSNPSLLSRIPLYRLFIARPRDLHCSTRAHVATFVPGASKPKARDHHHPLHHHPQMGWSEGPLEPSPTLPQEGEPINSFRLVGAPKPRNHQRASTAAREKSRRLYSIQHYKTKETTRLGTAKSTPSGRGNSNAVRSIESQNPKLVTIQEAQLGLLQLRTIRCPHRNSRPSPAATAL